MIVLVTAFSTRKEKEKTKLSGFYKHSTGLSKVIYSSANPHLHEATVGKVKTQDAVYVHVHETFIQNKMNVTCCS